MDELLNWLTLATFIICILAAAGLFFNVGGDKHIFMPRRKPRKVNK